MKAFPTLGDGIAALKLGERLTPQPGRDEVLRQGDRGGTQFPRFDGGQWHGKLEAARATHSGGCACLGVAFDVFLLLRRLEHDEMHEVYGRLFPTE